MKVISKKLIQIIGLDLCKSEWMTLMAMVGVTFTHGMSSSIPEPFYPKEAEKREVPPSQYGLVFGSYELVAFFVCLISGKYMEKIGLKRLVNFGLIAAGLTSISLGFLAFVYSHLTFLSLSFLLFILDSLGGTSAYVAIYAIATVVFSRNLAAAVAVLECSYGLGFTLGPVIGGFLYEVGGFMAPFDVLGSLFLLVGAFVFFAVPTINDTKDNDKGQTQILPLLRMKHVNINFLMLVAANLTLGFLLATLEPHLRQFYLKPTAVGAIFGVSAAANILTMPLVGTICDFLGNPKKVMILGCLLMIASFSLLGPFPYIPVDTAMWMVYLGLVLQGCGMSCLVVPAYTDAIQSAVRWGLPDDISTYCAVTAIATASESLGEFIGPTVAGVLFDLAGFRKSTLFVIVIYVMLFIHMTWIVCTEKTPSSGQDPISLAYDKFDLSSLHSPSTQESLAHESPESPTEISTGHALSKETSTTHAPDQETPAALPSETTEKIWLVNGGHYGSNGTSDRY